MANKYGNIDQRFASGYVLRLTWEETATNVSANTSTVKVTAKLLTDATYSISSSTKKTISITVDGTTQSGTCSVAIGASSAKDLITKTFTVKHNSDGSKTAAISCKLLIEVTLSGSYFPSVTASGSATLTKFAMNPSAPTSCTITAGYGSYVGLGDKVTISWSGASGTITGYELQYSRGNSGWKPYKTITSTAKSGSTTDSFTSTDINVNGAGKAVQYRIRTLNGSLASAWKASNILTMMGGMDLNANGSWKVGSVWINVNGSWKRAKRVWVNVNGSWKYSK